jgi:flagellar hook-length control protein FliK
LDVSTWSVIPQKRQATQPSVDRVDRVDQASVARVVPAPRQAPTVTAPRAATGSEIPPVIVPALPVEPDAPSHSPIESQVARPADARIDSPLRPHIDVKTDAPPVTMTPGPAATTTPAPVAEAASAPPPATPAPVQSMAPTAEDGTPVMPRLVEMMRWQAQEGGGQAQLRLRPELLGAVTVSIVVEHGAVKAIVSAETPAALEYLRAESSGLQEALEERGLTLDEFEVREESPLAERRRDPDDAPPRKETAPPAPRRRPADADGEAVFNVLM